MDSKYFFGGIFGGMTGIGLSHGFDTVRVRYQEHNYTSLKKCFTDIVSKEGFCGLYKGVTPQLFGIGLEKCIVFGFYNNISKQLMTNCEYNINNNNSKYYLYTFMSGVMAGLFCTSVVAPVEKLKIALQNNKKTDFNIKTFFKPSNLKNLYHGWSATLFREVPGYGIYFCTYEYLSKNFINTWYTPFIYGALSGASSWLFIYPADPIKTKMQNQNMSLIDSTKSIYKTYGIKGFYRGYTLGMLRAVPLHGGVFFGNSIYLKLIGNN